MARLTFLPSDDAYVRSYSGEPQAGIPVTVWTRQVGGTQVTDLVAVGYDGTLGAAITGGILVSDVSGLLPAFAGPDGGPPVLWGSHGVSGERLALYSVSGSGGGGGGSVFSVVGQTGTVTGSQILADSTVSTALSAKAPLASPTFTGTPAVPTASPGTATTQAASTAFVTTAVASGGGGGGAVSSVVGQTGSITGTQILADSTVSGALGLKAPLASPALTGTPTTPTASPGTSTTQVASTAFVGTAVAAGPADASVTLAKLAADASAAVGGTTTAAKTANYTAAPGETVPVDATSGALTITLPAASRARDRVVVKKVDSSTNAVTIARAGSDVINTAATSLNLALQHQSVVLRSTGAGVWIVEAGDLPYGALTTALTGTFGPGSPQWLQDNAVVFSFSFATITTTDLVTGLPTAGTITWPDGTGGAFTGTINGSFTGYSGYVVTWTGSTTKTVTVSGITYDANGNQLGPTGLVVS